MRRQKRLQIALFDPHGAPKPMRHQIAGLDPSADRACGNIEVLCHFGDREELDLIAPATGAMDLAGVSYRFRIAVAERHHWSTSYLEINRISGSSIFLVVEN
jgi:hypothetical protein